MKKLAVAAAVLAITALSWFQFPGHTWLQQDTQIYAPILEHLSHPRLFRREMLVSSPHVSFTLYDETARSLAAVTGLNFREVLETEQFVTRALGIWGVYLMASALGLSAPVSLFIAGAIALGAAVPGPAVLTTEIEPDPRGFAVPLLWLALGLTANRRDTAGGIAAGLAFLFHPPTALPFWGMCVIFGVALRRFQVFLPLAVATALLGIAAHLQEGAAEAQQFFARLSPEIEKLQRMRAPYSYISEWWRVWLPQYLIIYGVSVAACVRIRRQVAASLAFFLVGLPLAGILSVPLSFLLLEQMKWTLLPQWQPMRALLFVIVIMQFAGLAAAILAAQARRYAEALAWLLLAYVPPLNPNLVWLPPRMLIAALIALGALVALWAAARKFRWGTPALAAVATAAFVLIPSAGGISTHPNLHSADLARLSWWARWSTPRSAVFLFADAGKQLQPGIFRTEALRAVYVDWKGGGQVNYLAGLGKEWWRRWQQVNACSFHPEDVAHYHDWGIDYLVLSPAHALADRPPVFFNSSYVVYRL